MQVLTCRKNLGKRYQIGSFWKEVKRGEKEQRGTGPSCVLHIMHCELLTCYSYKSQHLSAGAQVSSSHTTDTAPHRETNCVYVQPPGRVSNALRSGKGAGLESSTLCAPGKHTEQVHGLVAALTTEAARGNWAEGAVLNPDWRGN